jgi:uncharacterized protein YecA (UPF0149 family)
MARKDWNDDLPRFRAHWQTPQGIPSETYVKRSDRAGHGYLELVEELGRDDPCPCGSESRFSRNAA